VINHISSVGGRFLDVVVALSLSPLLSWRVKSSTLNDWHSHPFSPHDHGLPLQAHWALSNTAVPVSRIVKF
jgi:hypothetical protein